jgi:hypothetical protein
MSCLCLEEVLRHIKKSIRYLNYFWGVIRERRTSRLNVNVLAVKQWSLTSLSLYRKGCTEVEWPEMDAISSLTNRDLCGAEFEWGHRWSSRKISVDDFMGRLVRVVCNFELLELWHRGFESLSGIDACALFYVLISCCRWVDFTSREFVCLKDLLFQNITNWRYALFICEVNLCGTIRTCITPSFEEKPVFLVSHEVWAARGWKNRVTFTTVSCGLPFLLRC